MRRASQIGNVSHAVPWRVKERGEQYGEKVAVPSLVGTTEIEAETTLTDAGLGVIKRYVAGEPDGTVYSQSSGKAAKGEVVTIDILRAPAAPLPVDLSAVTKSIGELKKTVAELKASMAELEDTPLPITRPRLPRSRPRLPRTAPPWPS